MKISVMGRWPLALGLTCAVWGLCAPHASAQTWEPLVEADPQGTQTLGSEDPMEEDWANIWTGGGISDGATLPSYMALAKQDGRVRNSWFWISGDPIPDSVFFKVTGHGRAFSSGGGNPTAKVTVLGKSVEGTLASNPANGNTAELSVTKYIKVKTNGQSVINSPWISLSVEAATTGQRASEGETQDYGFVTADVSAYAEPVDLAAVISSTVDQSYRKSTTQPTPEPGEQPLAPVFGTSPPVWKEAVPNGEPVHSAAYWDEDMGIWRGSVAVTANTRGVSAPAYKWTLSGDGTPSGGTPSPYPLQTWNLQGAIDSLRFTSDETTAPGASTFDLEVTDNANPSLEALKDSYTINWHMPEENFVEDVARKTESYTEVPLEPKLNPLSGTTPRYVGAGETAEAMAMPEAFTFRRAGTVVSLAVGAVGTGAAVLGAAAPVPPWIKGLTAVLGYTCTVYAAGGPQPTAVTLKNTYSEWTKSVNATKDNTGSYVYPSGLAQTVTLQEEGDENLDTIWKSCGMTIVRRQHYTDHYVKCDEYDSHGYAGEGDVSYNEPGIHEDHGEFLQNWQQVDP